jgi:hypothetical protein
MEHRAGSGGRQVEVLKTALKTQRSEAQRREEALQVLRVQPLFAVCMPAGRGHVEQCTRGAARSAHVHASQCRLFYPCGRAFPRPAPRVLCNAFPL